MDNRKILALDCVVKAAKKVGIDFFESAAALAVFAAESDPESELCAVCSAGDSIDEETAQLAHALMDKFKSASGMEILHFLGMVVELMQDDFVLDNDEEPDGIDAADASCTYFAMFAGMVDLCCAKYLSDYKPSRIGGHGRAEAYRRKKDAVIKIYTEMDGSHLMSAETAAGEILGRVDLSHRKIADTIREYRKMHDAKHIARNAE